MFTKKGEKHEEKCQFCGSHFKFSEVLKDS